MKTIIMGTTNLEKINQINGALQSYQIRVEGIQDKGLLPPVEDGETVAENAQKKALAYSKALGQTVLSMDNSLYIEGLSPDQQPGLHVRRVNGHEASSDEEMLDHIQNLIKPLGERIGGYWEYGVCVAQPDGKFWETQIRTPRIFTPIRSDKMVPFYPLESLQIDPESGQYISEMTREEMDQFWQRTLGKEVGEFLNKVLN